MGGGKVRPDTSWVPGGRCGSPGASHQEDQLQPAPWNAINATDIAVPADSSKSVVKDTVLLRQEGKQG